MVKIEPRSEDGLSEVETRSQFLALLAHELRNPLAPIRNAVQILRMSPDANLGQHGWLLPMMERQLAHMARLLDDLLDVSRIAPSEPAFARHTSPMSESQGPPQAASAQEAQLGAKLSMGSSETSIYSDRVWQEEAARLLLSSPELAGGKVQDASTSELWAAERLLLPLPLPLGEGRGEGNLPG